MRYFPAIILFFLAVTAAAEENKGGEGMNLEAMPANERLAKVMGLLSSGDGAKQLGEYLKNATTPAETECSRGILGFVSARRSKPGELEAIRLASVYKRAAYSKDAEIHKLALSALGALGRRGLADEDLAKLLKEGAPETRGNVLLAISSAGSEGVLPALEEFAKKKDLSARVKALVAQAAGGIRTPKAVKLISGFLADETEFVALNAVRALGREPLAEAVAALVTATDDKRPAVRAAAYGELFYFVPTGLLSGDDGRQFWGFAHKLNGEDAAVSAEIATLLTRAGRSEGLEYLKASAANIKGQATLVRAVTALSYAKAEDALPVITAILQTAAGDETISMAALRALGRTKNEAAVKALMTVYLGDGSPMLKEAALDGLYMAGGAPPSEIVEAVKAEKVRKSEALLLLSVARRPVEELEPVTDMFVKQFLDLPGRTLPTAAVILMARRGVEKAKAAFKVEDAYDKIVASPVSAFAQMGASEDIHRLAWIVAVMEETEGPPARMLSKLLKARAVWDAPTYFPLALAWREDIVPGTLAHWKDMPEDTQAAARDAMERFRDVRDPGADEDAAAYMAFFSGTIISEEKAIVAPQENAAAAAPGKLDVTDGRLVWSEDGYSKPPVVWLAIGAEEAERLAPVVRSKGGMVITSPYLPPDVLVVGETMPPAEQAKLARSVMKLADFLKLMGLNELPPKKQTRQISDDEVNKMLEEVKKLNEKNAKQ